MLTQPVFWKSNPLSHLSHYCDAHRDVEPIKQMFRLRIEIELKLAYSVAPIGEEGNLLIHLHILRLKHFKHPAFGLLGIAGD